MVHVRVCCTSNSAGATAHTRGCVKLPAVCHTTHTRMEHMMEQSVAGVGTVAPPLAPSTSKCQYEAEGTALTRKDGAVPADA